MVTETTMICWLAALLNLHAALLGVVLVFLQLARRTRHIGAGHIHGAGAPMVPDRQVEPKGGRARSAVSVLSIVRWLAGVDRWWQVMIRCSSTAAEDMAHR